MTISYATPTSLDENEQAIVDVFGDDKTSLIATVIAEASKIKPTSLVREAYWALVSQGLLVPSANGTVTLHAEPR